MNDQRENIKSLPHARAIDRIRFLYQKSQEFDENDFKTVIAQCEAAAKTGQRYIYAHVRMTGPLVKALEAEGLTVTKHTDTGGLASWNVSGWAL